MLVDVAAGGKAAGPGVALAVPAAAAAGALAVPLLLILSGRAARPAVMDRDACSACGYSLRGLGGRAGLACPECGAADPADLSRRTS